MNIEKSRVLISKYLYTELTAEEMQQLSGWIKASSANMDDFVREIVVHRAMRDQFLGNNILQSQQLMDEAELFEPRIPEQSRQLEGIELYQPRPPVVQSKKDLSVTGGNFDRSHPQWKSRSTELAGRTIALIAVGLLIAVATYLISSTQAGIAVAEVLDAIEARIDDIQTISPGRPLAPGIHRLEQGFLLVKFECEAIVVLEGPCVFNILTGNRCEILQGRICVTCPSLRSRSFVTQVRGHHVADLGTEYGVFVDENGSWETHVFEGKVAIQNELEEQEIRLHAGQSCAGPVPTLTPREGVNESRFLRQIDFEIRKKQAESGEVAVLAQLETEFRRDSALLFWLGMTPLKGGTLPVNLAPVRSGMDRVPALTQPMNLARDRQRGSVLEVLQPEHVVPMNIPGAHQALTLACWVKFYDESLTDREHRGLIMADDWNAPGRIHWQRKRDDIRITHPVKRNNRHSVYKAVTGRLVGNRWYHLVSVIDSGPNRSITHFLDGRLIESEPLPVNSPEFSLKNCTLGGWPGSHPDAADHRALNGAVDDVMIWKRALSSEEVGRLYQATLAK